MKLPQSFVTTSIASIIVVGLLTLVVVFQKKHDDASPPFTTRARAVTRNLLPATILPYITFGFTNSITDLYWLRAVQDFTVWDGKDPYYLNYFKNISALDPTFEYPYLFAILIVPKNKDVATLSTIADISERGIRAIPESWKIPFYLGTQWYLFTKKIYPAEEYLGIAASRKGAPDGVYLLYSTFVSRKLLPRIRSAEDYNTVQNLVKIIYNTTDSEIIKKMASKGLQENVIAQMLEKGVAAYKEKYKKFPKNIEVMMDANLISLPQEFLDTFVIDISDTTGKFKIVEKNN